MDYAAARKILIRQKGALTRAINSGDPAKVVRACADAVAEWEREDMYWPDNWHRWQVALNDALPRRSHTALDDMLVPGLADAVIEHINNERNA